MQNPRVNAALSQSALIFAAVQSYRRDATGIAINGAISRRYAPSAKEPIAPVAQFARASLDTPACHAAARMASGFRATIELIGINPFVALPPRRLAALFEAAGKQRGPLPVRVEIGGATFRRNVVKYQGAWRLYLNTPMRAAAGKSVGERVTLKVEFDPLPRVEPMPPALRRALASDVDAKAAFGALAPSRKKEIQRYLNSAKTAATLQRNVGKVMAHLKGEAPAGLAVLSRGQLRRGAEPGAARLGQGRASRPLGPGGSEGGKPPTARGKRPAAFAKTALTGDSPGR